MGSYGPPEKVVNCQLKLHLEAVTAGYSNEKITLHDEERESLLKSCDRLRVALASPLEAVTDLLFSTHRKAAVRLAIELGIFDILASNKGGLTELGTLSEDTKADPLLITRTMRLLSAMGYVNEAGVGAWTATPISNALVAGTPLNGMAIHYSDMQARVFSQLPEYFNQKGFSSPTCADSTPFNHTFNTPLKQFDWLPHHPDQHKAFNTMMTGPWQNRTEPWYSFFPVKERLSDPAVNASSALLVDIGGGLGVDLANFRNAFPSLPGRCILEDLPSVIAASEPVKAGAIDGLGHDFFAPQPIKGARAYYMRNVLHDWPDAESTIILKHTRDAMAAGSDGADSVLLIYDYVMGDAGVGLWPAQMDFTMMVMLGAMERTRLMWERLLEGAGLVLERVWAPQTGKGGSSLMECRLRV